MSIGSREVCGVAVDPDDRTYRPPQLSACRVVDNPFMLRSDLRVHLHTRSYKTRIVHFSIKLECLVGDAWECVVRADTAHSTVHVHHYRQGQGEVGPARVIRAIPPSPEGQQVVHDEFEHAWDIVVEHADEHLRGWKRDED